MALLDRILIKAYQRQESANPPATADSHQPDLARTARPAADREPTGPADLPSSVSAPATDLPRNDASVPAPARSTSGTTAATHSAELFVPGLLTAAEACRVAAQTPASSVGSVAQEKVASSTASHGQPATASRVLRVASVPDDAAEADESRLGQGSAGHEPQQGPASAEYGNEPGSAPASRLRAFQPAWEVDSLVLPAACQQIATTRRTEMQQLGRRLLEIGQHARYLVVGSWGRGEGRTTMTLCLATQLAQAGICPAVVDGDFDNPQLAQQLGLAVEAGWDNVVHGERELDDVCVHSLHDQITVVPLKHGNVDVHDQQVRRQVTQVLEELAQRFALILIDAGPGRQFWDHCQPLRDTSVVLVRDGRHTTGDELHRLIARLQQAHMETIGVIENFAA